MAIHCFRVPCATVAPPPAELARRHAFHGHQCARCGIRALTVRRRVQLLRRQCPGNVLQRLGRDDLEAAGTHRLFLAASRYGQARPPLVWCSVCGAYGQHMIRAKLRTACTGEPGTRGTHLARLNALRHPERLRGRLCRPLRVHGDFLAQLWRCGRSEPPDSGEAAGDGAESDAGHGDGEDAGAERRVGAEGAGEGACEGGASLSVEAGWRL